MGWALVVLKPAWQLICSELSLNHTLLCWMVNAGINILSNYLLVSAFSRMKKWKFL